MGTTLSLNAARPFRSHRAYRSGFAPRPLSASCPLDALRTLGAALSSLPFWPLDALRTHRSLLSFRASFALDALRPLYAAWPLLSLCAGKTLWPFLSHRTLWPNGASGDIQGHLSGREIIFAATGRGGGLLHVDPHLAEVVDLDLCLGEYLFDFLEDFLSLVLRGDGGFPVEGVVGFLCDVEELRHREVKVGFGERGAVAEVHGGRHLVRDALDADRRPVGRGRDEAYGTGCVP